MKADKKYLSSRRKRQEEFLFEKKGHLLVFADYTDKKLCLPMQLRCNYDGNKLSEEILQKHSFDMGVDAVTRARFLQCNVEQLSDDTVAGIYIDWGTGMTAALSTGADVIFEEGTSYSKCPVLKNLDDLDKLHFNPDNRWVRFALDFWRGVESEYDENFVVTPVVFRSPLDLANDIRGNGLFSDLYDSPELVRQLLDLCTESIIKLDRFFREEIRLLKEAPSGVWGVGIDRPNMIFLNGDPVDLISEDMGKIFNSPYVEKLIDYAGTLYFHHHSIGVSKALSVSNIKNLTVQEIYQDPNGPKLLNSINNDLIAASQITPIDLDVNLIADQDLKCLLEKLNEGRFIVRIDTETIDECRHFIEQIRKYSLLS